MGTHPGAPPVVTIEPEPPFPVVLELPTLPESEDAPLPPDPLLLVPLLLVLVVVVVLDPPGFVTTCVSSSVSSFELECLLLEDFEGCEEEKLESSSSFVEDV